MPAPKRVKTFQIPQGDGQQWKSANLLVQLKAQIPDSALLHEDIPGDFPAPKWRRRGQGSSKRRRRKGVAIQEAEGDEIAAGEKQKVVGWLTRAQTFQSSGYSMETNGSHASSGWSGRSPPLHSRNEIRKAYLDGSIKEIVANFFPIYCDLQRPAILLDADSRIFVYCTSQAKFLASKAELISDAFEKLLGPSLQLEQVRRGCINGERGPHFPCIIGHHRQYLQMPDLTKWHCQNMDLVEEFMANPVITSITKWVCAVVSDMFPGVAQQVNTSAQWHKEQYGIQPLFGLFWNLCINGIFPGQKRIHCLPHADSKNIVGVCVLVVYELPGKRFNHAKRTWLVLWEAGVAIQLLPWVMLCYPSSLLYHFNLDIFDFKFVTKEGDGIPTPENSTPIEDGDEEGRGSLVYFNQASMYQSSETGHGTLAEAIQDGYDGKADYGKSVEEAFKKHAMFSSIL